MLRLRHQRRAGRRVVEVAFTDAGLDLSERAGSDPHALAAGLDRVAGATGREVVRMGQVHGGDVAEVDDLADLTRAVAGVDALVTARDDVVLMTRAADCVPVLLADGAGAVVGAAHAGRGGVVANVAARVAERMTERGATGLAAWVGPHVCGACYEVPEALRAEVAALVPEAWAETRWGTPSLDLGAGVTAQLQAVGCEVNAVGGCTVEDRGFPSHRRDGAGSTRFAGLVWLSETGTGTETETETGTEGEEGA